VMAKREGLALRFVAPQTRGSVQTIGSNLWDEK